MFRLHSAFSKDNCEFSVWRFVHVDKDIAHANIKFNQFVDLLGSLNLMKTSLAEMFANADIKFYSHMNPAKT